MIVNSRSFGSRPSINVNTGTVAVEPQISKNSAPIEGPRIE
jgi:hypothetical protein